MRKFPVYIVVDVSESMAGEALTTLEQGMRAIVSDLMTDPNALETVWISVIAFAGQARTLVPMTELADFASPHLPVGGGTALGAALTHLMDAIDRDVQRSPADTKGDWKPLIFLLTDGVPTDNPETAIRRWERDYASRAALVAVSIGGMADRRVLDRIAEDVIALDDTVKGSFKRFIAWITSSVKASSQSVMAGQGVSLAKIDDRDTGKAAGGLPFEGLDDRYAVFIGRCARTKAPYIVKYERHMDRFETADPRLAELFRTRAYALQAAVPVQEDYFELSDHVGLGARVSSKDLIGQPDCPHCRAPYGMAQCCCGRIHCVRGEGPQTCPWCGNKGLYGPSGSGGGFDITRGQG